MVFLYVREVFQPAERSQIRIVPDIDVAGLVEVAEPAERGHARVVDKVAVVNRVWLFIDHQPRLHGTGTLGAADPIRGRLGRRLA